MNLFESVVAFQCYGMGRAVMFRSWLYQTIAPSVTCHALPQPDSSLVERQYPVSHQGRVIFGSPAGHYKMPLIYSCLRER